MTWRLPAGHRPGARLPHAWLPAGVSLYDRLGAGFTLLRRAGAADPAVRALRDGAAPGHAAGGAPGAPGLAVEPEFLLVRPDQRVASRAREPGEMDLDLVTGGLSRPPGSEQRGRCEPQRTGLAREDGRDEHAGVQRPRAAPAGTVVIEGDRIGADRSGAEVVDAAGGVLLPGLINAHVHVQDCGTLRRLCGFGVTSVLDMASGPPALVDSLRAVPGLTSLVGAGTTAIAPGSLRARFPVIGERGLIEGPDQAGQPVADRVAEGSDCIKIIVGSPGADHDQATVGALVAAAHRRGERAMARVVLRRGGEGPPRRRGRARRVPLDEALDGPRRPSWLRRA